MPLSAYGVEPLSLRNSCASPKLDGYRMQIVRKDVRRHRSDSQGVAQLQRKKSPESIETSGAAGTEQPIHCVTNRKPRNRR
jgi:hypothetical protein